MSQFSGGNFQTVKESPASSPGSQKEKKHDEPPIQRRLRTGRESRRSTWGGGDGRRSISDFIIVRAKKRETSDLMMPQIDREQKNLLGRGGSIRTYEGGTKETGPEKLYYQKEEVEDISGRGFVNAAGEQMSYTLKGY